MKITGLSIGIDGASVSETSRAVMAVNGAGDGNGSGAVTQPDRLQPDLSFYTVVSTQHTCGFGRVVRRPRLRVRLRRAGDEIGGMQSSGSDCAGCDAVRGRLAGRDTQRLAAVDADGGAGDHG